MAIKITLRKKPQECPECHRQMKKSRIINIICLIAYYSIFALLIYIAFFRPDITKSIMCCQCTSFDMILRNLSHNMTGIVG
jgi:hypothetical protein